MQTKPDSAQIETGGFLPRRFHLAASKGLTECLTVLLTHGADVNATNDDGGSTRGPSGRGEGIRCTTGPGSCPGSAAGKTLCLQLGNTGLFCMTLHNWYFPPVPSLSIFLGSTALHLATIACQPQCVKVLLQVTHIASPFSIQADQDVKNKPTPNNPSSCFGSAQRLATAMSSTWGFP